MIAVASGKSSLAPGAGQRVEDKAHIVQFYESDEFLVETLTRFVADGLRAGDAVVVIATRSHRDPVEARLGALGVDVEHARATRRYVAIDAAETLATIMVGAMPDAARFADVVGAAIASTSNGTQPRVRAFGEMVGLLWADGNREGAIRLEALWNDLLGTRPVALLCAYPLGVFGSEADVEPFMRMCGEHGSVIPAESYSGLARPEEQHRAIARLQSQAQRLGREERDRHTAETALRAHQREMDDFFETAAMALHWVAPDGTILRANRAELDLLGYAPEEYVGHHIAEFHVEQSVIDDILRRLARGETLHAYEARLRCKDGSIKDVLIDSNVLWQDGKFAHSRCFTSDISERKRAEREREQLLVMAQRARADAEAASRAKDEFLSVMSHELRTPLAAMLGWVGVLKTGVTGERATRALETIERSGRAQAKLIEDLVDLSRIGSGQLRLDVRLVDLPAVIQGALDTIRHAADTKGLRLEVRLDPAAGPIAGDAERLQQVAWNLLSNAVKFTPAGGLIQVSLERRDGDVRLTVRDTGRGISAEFVPFVFERFRQADMAESRRTSGLGLGLAIVRHLVELHGGDVAVASDGEDRGTVFTVTLPTPLRLDALATGGAATPGLLGGRRVLVVDDEPDAREALQLLLEAHGADVAVAGSVRDALHALNACVPDVVVSDIHLPDEDGYALVRALRATDQLRRLPAIAVTGFDGAGECGRALAAGYQMRLMKPVEPELLVTAISRLADRASV